jgi:hypothetical protein
MMFLLRNSVIKKPLVKPLFSSPITKAVFVLFFWNIFIGTLSYSKGYQLQNVLRDLAKECFMLIVIFIPFFEDIDLRKQRFFKYVVILSTILALFGFMRYFLSHDIEFTSSGTVRTLLGNCVVIFMFPVCYILFYSDYWREHKGYAFLLIVLFTLGIHFTGHRSGFIVLIFAIAIYFVSTDFNISNYLWIPLIGVTLLIAVILAFPMLRIAPGKSIVGDSILRASDTFDLDNKTTQERISKWRLSVEIMKDKPLLGLGRLPVYTWALDDEHKMHLGSFSELDKATHNFLANKLVHEGLLGLSANIIFLYIILIQFRKISLFDRRYSAFLAVYTLSFLLFSMFNTSFTSSEGKIYFFTLLGFLNAEILRRRLYNHKIS